MHDQAHTNVFRKDHIPELDGLRGLAVLLVLWVHLPVAALGPGMQAVRRAVVPGNLGVDLFFVLSGFLITRILLVDRGRGVPVRYFMLRRFLRIFPIYYLTILLVLPRLWTSEAVAAATYTSNYVSVFRERTSVLEHAWSLAVEEHFYLFWPPIVAFLRPRTSYRVLVFGILPLALLTIFGALLAGPWKEHPQAMLEFVLRTSTSRFLSLGLGAVLAYHELRVRSSRWLAMAIVVAAGTMGALLTVRGLRATGLMPFFASLSATEGEPRFFMAPLRVIGFPCISLSVIVAAVAWSGSRAPFAWIFRIRLLGWIGRISYGLYLYHFPIFRSAGIWGVDSPLPEPVRTAAVLALCFAVASASYWILERPLLRFGARFRGTAPTAGAEAIRPSKTRLALSVGAAALLVASMFVIFRGGDTALVNGAADRFGRPMDVESAGARARANYPQITGEVESLARGWRAEPDEQANLGPRLAELRRALSAVELVPFDTGVTEDGWGATRTGCFFDADTGKVYVDVSLLDRLSTGTARPAQVAVSYEVCSAVAACIQAGWGSDSPATDASMLGLERDVIAGRIARLHDSGILAVTQPSTSQIERGLRQVEARHSELQYHLGSWSFPGRLEHASLKNRARWFLAGRLRPEDDHGASIRNLSADGQ